MKLFSLVFIYLFVATSAFSQEMKAELNIISPPSILKEGDIVEGILKIWPLENADLNEFKKLENMNLANYFYVTEVENVEVSANNADVVEAKVLFIVKRFAEKNQQKFNYQGRLVDIQVPSLNIAPSDKDPEDYYILDQGLIYSNLGKIIISVLLLLLALMLFLKRKAIGHFVQKFKNDPIANSKKKFDEKFSKASTRENYEEIYAKRREWLSLIKELAPAYNDFFKTMEEHQYKELWDAEDLNLVESSFDTIRGSFK